jgi:hypothetical protein
MIIPRNNVSLHFASCFWYVAEPLAAHEIPFPSLDGFCPSREASTTCKALLPSETKNDLMNTPPDKTLRQAPSLPVTPEESFRHRVILIRIVCVIR